MGPKMLYIEPVNPCSDDPIIDDLTMKMTAAYRLSEPTRYMFQGFHSRSCGAWSDSKDHFLPDGTKTNSLCIHYLAYHRQDVPKVDLVFASELTCGTQIPNSDELHGPIVHGRDLTPIDALRECYDRRRRASSAF